MYTCVYIYIHIYIYTHTHIAYMCMHIYIYIYMAVSTLFVTKASTETLNDTSLGVFVASSPPCPIVLFKSEGAKQKLHPKSYRLAKRQLAT